MHPKAHISHQAKGRLRVKVPAKKGDAPFFSSVREKLLAHDGIAEVEVNPVTGSVLIKHGSDIKAIAKYAEEGRLFRVELKTKKHPPISHDILSGFRGIDGTLRKATDGEFDVPSVAFLTLIGFGIYDISRGNFAAPAWYTAFWYALNIFLKAKPDGEVEAELA